jgi:hypothetical protein
LTVKVAWALRRSELAECADATNFNLTGLTVYRNPGERRGGSAACAADADCAHQPLRPIGVRRAVSAQWDFATRWFRYAAATGEVARTELHVPSYAFKPAHMSD